MTIYKSSPYCINIYTDFSEFKLDRPNCGVFGKELWMNIFEIKEEENVNYRKLI